jgi:hypothetical protein
MLRKQVSFQSRADEEVSHGVMTSQSAAFVLDYVMLTRMLPKMLLPGGILELMVYSQQVRPLCPTGNWCEAHET